MASFLDSIFNTGSGQTEPSNGQKVNLGTGKENFLFGHGASTIGGYISGRGAQDAQKKAADEAEKARRMSLIKQMGAKQQADSMALAGLKTQNNTTKPSGNNTANQSPGFIGSGLTTTAGTFV